MPVFLFCCSSGLGRRDRHLLHGSLLVQPVLFDLADDWNGEKVQHSLATKPLIVGISLVAAGVLSVLLVLWHYRLRRARPRGDDAGEFRCDNCGFTWRWYTDHVSQESLRTAGLER